MAVRKKRSISIPPELDAEIAAAAQDAGMSYSAWIAQTARKEFIIRAGLEAVSQYEAEHGPFTPDEIAEADEWAAKVLHPSAALRRGDLILSSDEGDLAAIAAAVSRHIDIDHP